jgi:enterochelin esterase-like enzyme
MVAPRHTTLNAEYGNGRRGQRGRVVRDLLVLLTIVVIGAVGAIEAGIWAMPANGSPAGHVGQALGVTPGTAGAAADVSAPAGSGGPGDSAAANGGGSSLPSGGSASGGTTGTQPVAAGQAAPWKAWKPAEAGVATTFQLPAPWVGGTMRTINVVVYLPGGYTTSNRAYPVIYELPFSWQSWDAWIGVKATLDSQMSSGAIPASIVVFVQPAHGPYHDSECVNSADGRQQLETFFSTTLVQAIDSRFRTIQSAAARSLLGFSQGGFCGPMLALRHPDVFSTAIAISGYYQAGIHDVQTPFAWRPFGGNAALEASYSPLQLVGQLSAAQRASMLLILEADPAQPFYGPQFAAMLAASHRAGVAVLPLPMTVYHSWIAVKAVLPRALQALAAHEAALGVFG